MSMERKCWEVLRGAERCSPLRKKKWDPCRFNCNLWSIMSSALSSHLVILGHARCDPVFTGDHEQWNSKIGWQRLGPISGWRELAWQQSVGDYWQCQLLQWGHCESKWVIWVGQTTQTQHQQRTTKWASGGVPPQYQRGFTYGEGDASTPKGWCRCG